MWIRSPPTIGLLLFYTPRFQVFLESRFEAGEWIGAQPPHGSCLYDLVVGAIKIVSELVLTRGKREFSTAPRSCDDPLLCHDGGIKTEPLNRLDNLGASPALTGPHGANDRSVHITPILAIRRFREIPGRRATEAAAGAVVRARPPFGQIPTLDPGV